VLIKRHELADQLPPILNRNPHPVVDVVQQLAAL
jgi:hypothetical protein